MYLTTLAPITGFVKRGGEPICGTYQGRISQLSSNKKLVGTDHMVVGGTAWCFADEDFTQAYDYIFVDEAGQVSLANILAMAPSAKNIVLVGDQQQLPQVVLGTHPGEASLSCFEYLLHGHKTIPSDAGVFLPTSRRMHKMFVKLSQDLYENKLYSDEPANNQSLVMH